LREFECKNLREERAREREREREREETEGKKVREER
jgi:hypothetical protein